MAKGAGVAGILRTGGVVLLAATLLVIFQGCSREEPSRAPAKPAVEAARPVAADFAVATLAGDEFRLSAYRGKPLVLNFWASWCGPCRFEAPTLREAHGKYGPRGVVFFGVAVQDTDERARAFIDKFGLSFPNGRDTTGEIMKTYEIFAIPQTFIIDRHGRISYVHTGPLTADLLDSELEKVL